MNDDQVATKPPVTKRTPARRSGFAGVLGFLGLALVPTLILLDVALAYGRGWAPEGRLDKLVIYFAAAALTVLALGLLVPRFRRFLRAGAPQIVVLAVSVTATWLLLEGGLWASRIGTNMPHYAPNMKQVLRPAPGALPGLEGEQRFTTNSRGARGPELPADRSVYRILCVGGSTTECLYVDDTIAWPQQLMDELNRGGQPSWVGNVGMAGMSSVEHRRVVEQSDLMADVDCVVIMLGINDLFRALQNVSTRQIDQGPVWADSRVLGLVRKVWHTSNRGNTQVQDDTGQWMVEARRGRQQARFVEEYADADRHLQEYVEQLHLICDACQSRNVRLVFLSQPVIWSADLPPEGDQLLWMGRIGSGLFLTVPKLRAAMDRYNEALRRVSAERGVGFIELSPVSGRVELFYDDAHFNEDGCREVARRVGEWFLNN